MQLSDGGASAGAARFRVSYFDRDTKLTGGGGSNNPADTQVLGGYPDQEEGVLLRRQYSQAAFGGDRSRPFPPGLVLLHLSRPAIYTDKHLTWGVGTIGLCHLRRSFRMPGSRKSCVRGFVTWLPGSEEMVLTSLWTSGIWRRVTSCLSSWKRQSEPTTLSSSCAPPHTRLSPTLVRVASDTRATS